jgi:2-hydroxycyclohexanecarboxyl-CoA dehydrogenase
MDNFGFFVYVTQEQWRQVLNINLGGTMNCTHAALAGMQERGYGRIVNIASEAGRVGSKGSASYSAAKAGVIGFTKAIAREAARYGVTANAIAPGPIETPLLMGAKEFGEIGEKVIETMRASTQMGRLGQPEEVAAAVAFLASDDASYVTGETLGVSGGLGMV